MMRVTWILHFTMALSQIIRPTTCRVVTSHLDAEPRPEGGRHIVGISHRFLLVARSCILMRDEEQSSCRFDSPNAPFYTLEQAVWECKTARFAAQSTNTCISTTYIKHSDDPGRTPARVLKQREINIRKHSKKLWRRNVLVSS